MKVFALQFFAGLSLICLFGCAHGTKPTGTAAPAKLEGEKKAFTGKVVLVVPGYRFRPVDEPEALLRFTRAQSRGSFASDEIKLRKYYGKTLTVRGKREGEWIWDAEIVGQWLQPGETRSATLTGPEPAPRRH